VLFIRILFLTGPASNGMKPEIQKIIQELYAIDPGLKKYEPALIKLIEELLLAKPDTKFDKSFARRLRTQLLGETKTQYNKPLTRIFMNFINKNNMPARGGSASGGKKFGYLISGAVLTLIIVVPVLISNGLFSNKAGSLEAPLSATDFQKITLLQEDEAFGSFASIAPIEGRGAAAPSAAPAAQGLALERTQAGGGGGTSFGLTADASKSTLIYPFYRYQYVYNGEPLTLEQDKMEVLRRTAGNLGNLTASRILGNLNFGLANLSSLGNSKVKTVYFGSDQEGGYNVSLNLENGMISIDKFVKWSQEAYQPLTMDQMPADDQIIALANQFLTRFSVDKTNYENPVVDNRWRTYYELAEDKTNYYLPDTITVIYPLKINNIVVYNQGGDKDGLYVNVNVRTKEVYSLYNLASQTYEGSLYPVQTDIQSLLGIVNGQGQDWQYPEDVQIQTLEIELGAPTLAFTKVWNYRNDLGEELLVPAYIFPVLNKPADQPYFQDNLVLPIVEDLLRNQYGFGGGPVMPLLEKAVETQVAPAPADLPQPEPGLKQD